MTLKFPDLSHYKTGVDVSGYPALITKATEGTSMVDGSYAGYKQAAARAGIPFLPYHFLHHGNIAAQVNHVLEVVGARTLMLDVESEPNMADSTLADVEAFMDAYAAKGGRVVLNYIPRWYWSGQWGSPSLKPLQARGAGLISSQYTTYADDGPGWNSYGGVTPVIWQYTSTAGAQDLDMNAFKGTRAELAALFAGSSGDGSTITTGDDDMQLTDKLADGTTVGQALSLILGRSANLGPWEKQELDALTAKVDGIAATVAALPTTAAPAAPLSDADKDDIAKRVADLLAGRLES